MSNIDYKAAYERQKKAREQAEALLESRSSELYGVNQSLSKTLEKLKDQKAQMLHQEKLASIGQLAAGVAHEINNPAAFVKSNMGAIKRYVKAIKKAFADNEKLIETLPDNVRDSAVAQWGELKEGFDLDYILDDFIDIVEDTFDGVDRIEDIVKSLKNFARPDQGSAVRFNINTCIENTLKVAWGQIKYKAALEKNLEDIPDVLGQPGSMGQVFLNLLVNASQAIEENGCIILTSRREGSYAVVTIKDDGCGISQENIHRIFDPFFSTKKQGEGTGLGLSISHGIVRNNGGTLNVESEVGVGTQFTLRMPLADDAE